MSKLSLILEALNWKTLSFNFKNFPLKTALRFPVVVSRHTRIRSQKGTIKGNIIPGMIRIGFDAVGIFDNKRCRSIWQNNGNIIFHGAAFLGHGTKIGVAEGSTLEFGENFKVTAQSSIVCNESIKFGRNCLLSWDILIIDSDFHSIYNSNNDIINPKKAITFGDNVWVGCRCTILKGVNIANGSVIAASSTIAQSIETPDAITGGILNRTLKNNIRWKE